MTHLGLSGRLYRHCGITALLVISQATWAQSLGTLVSNEARSEAPIVDSLKRTTPRSSIYSFLQACHSGEFEIAAQYLDLRRIRTDQRPIQGPVLARDLGQILDRDTRFEVGRLSNEPDGNTRDGLASLTDTLTSISLNTKLITLTMQRVAQGNMNVWLVSSDTVASIPRLRASADESEFEKRLPESLVETRFIGTSLWVWIALILAALLISLFSRLLSKLFLLGLKPIADRYTKLHAHRLEAFVEPLRLVLSVMVFGALIEVIGPSALLRDYLFKLLTLMFVLGCVSIVMRVVDVISDTVSSRLDPRQRAFSYSVLPLIVRGVKIILFCVAVLFVLSAWGYNTNTLLAGLGVGGVAVALASQKTIENLFGGISVISDRPVLVGDFCQFGGQVGTVEDIGLRSTRIRTLDRTLVTVPNSQFSTMTLENFSKRDRMWFHPTLHLRRDTQPEQIRQMMEATSKILHETANVDPSSVPVRFTKITKESFDLEVFAYVLTPDFDEYLRVQTELLFKLLEAASRLKVEFAVPINETVAPLITLGSERSADKASPLPNAYQSDRKIPK